MKMIVVVDQVAVVVAEGVKRYYCYCYWLKNFHWFHLDLDFLVVVDVFDHCYYHCSLLVFIVAARKDDHSHDH